MTQAWVSVSTALPVKQGLGLSSVAIIVGDTAELVPETKLSSLVFVLRIQQKMKQTDALFPEWTFRH